MWFYGITFSNYQEVKASSAFDHVTVVLDCVDLFKGDVTLNITRQHLRSSPSALISLKSLSHVEATVHWNSCATCCQRKLTVHSASLTCWKEFLYGSAVFLSAIFPSAHKRCNHWTKQCVNLVVCEIDFYFRLHLGLQTKQILFFCTPLSWMKLCIIVAVSVFCISSAVSNVSVLHYSKVCHTWQFFCTL